MIDNSLLTLIISLFTCVPIQLSYSSSIPSSTRLLLTHCQPITHSILVHHVDLFVLYLRIVILMDDEQSEYWLAQTLELIKNEWNCKLLSNHSTFISELLFKYQTTNNASIKQLLFQLLEMILSFSISPSSLSSLLSYFTSEKADSHDILTLLNKLYTLPCVSPEILLDEGSRIQFTGDNKNSVRIPNKDDWCFIISMRCISESPKAVTLLSFKEEKNELSLQLQGNSLQLMVNRLSVINSIPFTPNEL